MHLLVAYASVHGSTREIASAIAGRLRSAGHVVDLQPVDEIDALVGVDGVVLGSAIHNRAWLPPAVTFVEAHVAELSERPVWLFSVSSVGDTTSVFGQRIAHVMRRTHSEPSQVRVWRGRLPVRGHRNFAGVIERSHWGLAGNVFLRAFGGTYGDHRDWQDIDRWADQIAAELVSP